MSARIRAVAGGAPFCPPVFFSWPCDDERQGFSLQVLRAGDGDFHVQVVPHPEHEHGDLYVACHRAALRIRTPLVGGGRHERLWWALNECCKAEQADAQDREDLDHSLEELASNG